jgi:NADPH:quinone reductase-like Zn-dependent oxidoreductase
MLIRAIVQCTYGSPDDVLELKEIDKPVLKDDDVLVRVHPASIHVGDWVAVRGVPYVMRRITRLLGPRNRVPEMISRGRLRRSARA